MGRSMLRSYMFVLGRDEVRAEESPRRRMLVGR